MLSVNMDDVMQVVSNIQNYLIAFGVVVVVALVAMFAAKKLPKAKKKMVRAQSGVAILLALVIVVNLICIGPMSTMLDLVSGEGSISEETSAEATELVNEITQEGIVLAQNDDNILPVASGSKLNVFGWASTSPCYGGTGSGALNDAYPVTDLLTGLHDAGIETNDELSKFYTDYCATRPSVGMAQQDWTLPEPNVSLYTDEMMANAKEYSDTAMVVITRVGGEGADLPTDMAAVVDGSWVRRVADYCGSQRGAGYYNGSYDDSLNEGNDWDAGDHFLQLSNREEELIDLVTSNFDNVIVVYNGANAFEMGWVKDYPQIKGVLLCPGTGQSGFEGFGRVVAGEVNPSGRTADTYVTDLTASPWWNNFGDFKYTNASEFNSNASMFDPEGTSPSFVNYVEGIYVGYKFYETAADEGLIDYDKEVVYPFGYGLSYTSFDWSDFKADWSGDTCTAQVTVTNTGDVSGKDVVEVYVQSPYTDYDKTNGVEKPAVELVGYGKTAELAPGASETVSVTFTKDQLKAYDANGAKTYILDAGDYYITAAKDAHEAVNNVLAAKGKTAADGMTADGDAAFTAVYTPANTETDTTTYATDSRTGAAITNQLDAAKGDAVYLTRSDWTGTFPKPDGEPSDVISTWGNEINGTDADGNPASYQYKKTADAALVAQLDSADSGNPTVGDTYSDTITYGAKNGLSLIDLRGKSYDDPMWNDLLDQLTAEDYYNIITCSGYGVPAIDSVGKPFVIDADTASGLIYGGTGAMFPNMMTLAQTWNQDLALEYGTMIGNEAVIGGCDGWYAPSMNIHRTPFSGRNGEYYSEDPFLSGTVASKEVYGAATKGLYAYIKHFAFNDQENHRGDREGQYGAATWLNEQSAREIYLKPFEMCMKLDDITLNYVEKQADGSYQNAETTIPAAMGVMTAFNRIGATWTGGSYALITGILRTEWGFNGAVITDNANTGVFMLGQQMIEAGADMKLTYDTSAARWDNYDANDPETYHYAREALHHVLYTTANTKAMNHAMPGSVYKDGPQIATVVRTVVNILCTLLLVFFAYRIFRVWKPSKRKLAKLEAKAAAKANKT